MSLIDSVADEFEPHVQDRGQSYFESGAVNVYSVTDRMIRARVEGSDTYEVRIQWDGEMVDWRCSCPYFAEHDQCKHIWATLLEADHRGVLPDLESEDSIPTRIQTAIERFKDRILHRPTSQRESEPSAA
ncbi:MAG TPA: SWIM zinc finger family protein, partial [Tepidisphaeraceae bacterium]